MDGLHDANKGGKGQLGNAGNGGFQHHGNGAQLEGQHTAENRGKNNLDPAGRLDPHGTKQAAAHDGPPHQVIAHEAAVEGHVPAVCPQRQQAAVGKEQTLYGEDHHHGQEARLGAQQCGEQHAAAKVAGGAGSRNGVVDHLPGKNQCGRNSHGGKFCGRLILFQGLYGSANRYCGSCIHGGGHSRRQQRVCHMHIHTPLCS